MTINLDQVPENTIRKSWDGYINAFPPRDSVGEKYNDTWLNGVHYKETHKDNTKCNIFGNNCDGRISAVKVPIGGRAIGWEDDQCNNDKLWDYSEAIQRMNDDVATGCAGGSKLGWDRYLTTQNGKKCYNGTDWLGDKNDLEQCVVGGVEWNSFCQLGDYVVNVPECKDKCKDAKSTDNGNNYCNWAMDRLCGKTINDNIKQTEYGSIVKSDKNWILDDSCRKYCGESTDKGNDYCQDAKKRFCSNPEFLKDRDSVMYCFEYWKKYGNAQDFSNAFDDILTDASNPYNISKSNDNIYGPNFLCRNNGSNPEKDVNSGWCNTARGKFCTKNTNNMGTNYCFNHCRDYPGDCENYLKDTFCKNKEDKLEFLVGDTDKRYKDYCACFQSPEFYEKYRDEVFKPFEEAGYEIQGISSIPLQAVCIYPDCKAGAIVPSDQKEAQDTNCGVNCVQLMGNLFMDKFQNNGDITQVQDADCANIKANYVGGEQQGEITPPGGTGNDPPGADNFIGGSILALNFGTSGVPLTDEEQKQAEGAWAGIGILIAVALIFMAVGLALAVKKMKSR